MKNSQHKGIHCTLHHIGCIILSFLGRILFLFGNGGLGVIHIAKMALLVISDVGEKGLGNKAVAEFGGQRQSRWGGRKCRRCKLCCFGFLQRGQDGPGTLEVGGA